MSPSLSLSALAREEYTGENRCWPCTALNLVLLAVGCGVASVVSPVAGVALAAVGCGAIWLRGYVLPYTPRIGPRVAARLPGNWGPFRADRPAAGETTTLADASAADGEAVLESLVDAGVVRPEGAELSLDPAFARRWDEEMAALRSASLDDLAAATLDAAPSASAADTYERRDRRYVVLSDGSGEPSAESWLRRPVAIGETAAARALADYDVDPGRRAVAAGALSLFLTECPACGGEVAEGVAGDCCGPPRTGPSGEELRALFCADCGVELHVFD